MGKGSWNRITGTVNELSPSKRVQLVRIRGQSTVRYWPAAAFRLLTKPSSSFFPHRHFSIAPPSSSISCILLVHASYVGNQIRCSEWGCFFPLSWSASKWSSNLCLVGVQHIIFHPFLLPTPFQELHLPKSHFLSLLSPSSLCIHNSVCTKKPSLLHTSRNKFILAR